MSVLCEGVSVVVARAAIDERFDGGLLAFKAFVPNRTYCEDQWLVRVGFANEPDAMGFIDVLTARGLVVPQGGEGGDILIVYSNPCRSTSCDWTVLLGWKLEGVYVFTCEHREAHFSPQRASFVCPPGWRPSVPEDYSPVRGVTEIAGELRERDLN